MPILFMIVGVMFLFELIVGRLYEKQKGERYILLIQFFLIMLSYFVKPVAITSSLGIGVPAVIALVLGVRLTKKNLLATLIGTSIFIFVYLLSSLYNYELLSIMNISFYCVLLLFVGFGLIQYPNVRRNILSFAVLCSFIVDYYLVSSIGGFVVIGASSLTAFVLVVDYLVTLISSVIKKKEKEKKYEKVM